MILITGDTHIPIDIHKLNTRNFKEQNHLNKNDYVIICGDFGGVWSNNNEDKYWQKWLKDKNFTTLFIDGNHENFDLLNSYNVSKWNGGNVHFINDSVIHLMRGQIFTIDGINLFTMGGATSIDKHSRIEGKTWWQEEMPSNIEYNEALNNLDKHNWEVDYIITHTAPLKIAESIVYSVDNNSLYSFFNMLQTDLWYKHWYFGHFHEDKKIDNKHTVVFNRIIKLL